MSEQIVAQVRFVLASFCTGMLLIVAYDLFRFCRLLISHRVWIIWLEDVVFWGLASLPVFHLFLIYNEGILRWYGLLGILLGALLQEFGISLPIRQFMEKRKQLIVRKIRQKKGKRKRKNPLQKGKTGV